MGELATQNGTNNPPGSWTKWLFGQYWEISTKCVSRFPHKLQNICRHLDHYELVYMHIYDLSPRIFVAIIFMQWIVVLEIEHFLYENTYPLIKHKPTVFELMISQQHCWCMPGPCITNVIATCRKNFSQWDSSFLWKLRCHWLKFLRRVAKNLVIQGPAAQYRCCVVMVSYVSYLGFMWPSFYNRAGMFVSEGLTLVGHQHIFNYHDYVGRSVHIRVP